MKIFEKRRLKEEKKDNEHEKEKRRLKEEIERLTTKNSVLKMRLDSSIEEMKNYQEGWKIAQNKNLVPLKKISEEHQEKQKDKLEREVLNM